MVCRDSGFRNGEVNEDMYLESGQYFVLEIDTTDNDPTPIGIATYDYHVLRMAYTI